MAILAAKRNLPLRSSINDQTPAQNRIRTQSKPMHTSQAKPKHPPNHETQYHPFHISADSSAEPQATKTGPSPALYLQILVFLEKLGVWVAEGGAPWGHCYFLGGTPGGYGYIRVGGMGMAHAYRLVITLTYRDPIIGPGLVARGWLEGGLNLERCMVNSSMIGSLNIEVTQKKAKGRGGKWCGYTCAIPPVGRDYPS
jgi:hypothetical protein